jgi:8-oxo-dGTP diphosphatase
LSDALRVAVAVLQRPNGRVLVAHRDPARHQGGGLEFPGGKIEPGESPVEALERELAEEIGVRPRRSAFLISVPYRYRDRTVVLEVYRVTGWDGQPTALEGGAVEWQALAELDTAAFPSANHAIVAALTGPERSPVTSPIAEADRATVEALASMCRRQIERGRLVRVRRGPVGTAGWRRLIDRLSAVAVSTGGGRLVVDARGTNVSRLPQAVGLHLPAAQARQCYERPVASGRLLTCACHDAAELEHAHTLAADWAYVGPVHSTPSHPEVEAQGWAGFSRLAQHARVSLYAIGGLTPDDLGTARSAGAVGVAGIRAFWDA